MRCRVVFPDYDGGDCCECTCVSTFFYPCGANGYKCADPAASCSGGLVDAGTFTTIVTTASAFDERPGAEGNDIGCGEDGCAPSLARDGDVSDAESRWSCAGKIVPEIGQCELYFSFESPQNIKTLEVAFWKSNQRERTLEVRGRNTLARKIEWFLQNHSWLRLDDRWDSPRGLAYR